MSDVYNNESVKSGDDGINYSHVLDRENEVANHDAEVAPSTENSSPAATGTIYNQAHHFVKDFFEEVISECIPTSSSSITDVRDTIFGLRKFLFMPYIPAISKPGWLKRYIMGPYNDDLLDSFICDMWAGTIVALTLIPQGLSYAKLANMPPITGLYCAVLPYSVYIFLGSSMQLGVGPVAIVSLLVGQIISKYIAEPTVDTDAAIGLGGQISLVCGIYLVAMGFSNMGNLIRFISHPVMSGFTTAAAMLIGLSQLKNAFGFPSLTPQTGQEGYEYNYQIMHWYITNWNSYYVNKTNNIHMYYRNYLAINICFGIYIPLLFVYLLKKKFRPTLERKKKYWFRCFTYIANMMPLFAIIVSASVAKELITHGKDSSYARNIGIVGELPSGLNILRGITTDYPWVDIFNDTLPLTLISFMESFSVARRIASQRNELHILNASQELFAIGMANIVGSFSSCFPVSGSFSRSSLNAASGARTPLSKATTMMIVIIALLALTKQFRYIPSAALAAIIWIAITDLLAFNEFWDAWKYSKKDFLTMFTTFIMTFVFDTEIGLAVGIGCSVLVLLYDYAYAKAGKPDSYGADSQTHDSGERYANRVDVEFIRLHNDLVFLTIPSFKDYISDEIIEKKYEHLRAVVIDFVDVRVVDLTGLIGLKEILEHSQSKGVLFGGINMSVSVHADMVKFGILLDSLRDIDQSTILNGGSGSGNTNDPPSKTFQQRKSQDNIKHDSFPPPSSPSSSPYSRHIHYDRKIVDTEEETKNTYTL